MEILKKNAANLLKVKTIVTLLLTVVFCVLALTGTISGADFLQIFAIVITFYFCSQNEKKAATTYTGPQQSGETVVEQAVPMTETMDAAVQNDVHPPDDDIVVKGFGG